MGIKIAIEQELISDGQQVIIGIPIAVTLINHTNYPYLIKMSNGITKEIKQKKLEKKNQIVPKQGTISFFL